MFLSAILAASGRSDLRTSARSHSGGRSRDECRTTPDRKGSGWPDVSADADRAGRHLRRARGARADRRARQVSVPTAQYVDAAVTDLRFTHLTTNDGLSQGYVVDILQDRRGFMWFATRDGLNRYDGYTFVVYKHNPNDPGSLSSNFLQDLMEDDHGYLWIATNTGVNQIRPYNRTLYPLPSRPQQP